jgi:ankyrin repeat protein
LLFYALEHCDLEVVDLLVSAGAGPNTLGVGRRSALLTACLNRRLDAAALVLRAAVPDSPKLVELEDEAGNSPIKHACSLGLYFLLASFP